MKITFALFFLLLLFGCRHDPGASLLVEYEKFLDSIPSASALVIKDTVAYIVCDDGTGLYTINLKSFRENKIPVTGFDFHAYREDRSVKHDFECASLVTWQNKEYLIALGSGSGDARDSMLMINTANYVDQRIYSLEKFYKGLRSTTLTDSLQLNIEGVTVAGDSIIILNRGNNLLVTCGLNAFMSFVIKGMDSLPAIKYRKIKLPLIAQHEGRFSGICTIDEKHLLFCASVEDTPDWTKDGPVLGSYFGIYSLQEGKVTSSYLLTDKQNQPLKEKIESVEILQKDSGDLVFLATGDNDNGSSKLFRIRLHGFR